MTERSKILLIYTGGTIGMVQDHISGKLYPFGFDTLLENIPELKRFEVDIDTTQLSRIIDSSDMEPALWTELLEVIRGVYEDYDGFVILHGTDTLAYTSAALSFMIQDLDKPIILTGSQLPIGTIRTDGKENLITAIEIASSKEGGKALVPEVAVYFEYTLLRGCRVTKYSAEHFDAFHSPNYPELAEAGIQITYNDPYIRKTGNEPVRFSEFMDSRIAILKLFPGITEEHVRYILASGVRGMIMETYGAGNGPSAEWFITALKEAIDRGMVIFNVSQCLAGSVQHGRYATSSRFEDIGVVSGRDICFEAAITKMMYALGQSPQREVVEAILSIPLAGEMMVDTDI
ncbi:MAG: asparaginase [Bacteroidetes bacterium]|nr:asparaginase [Bacteroidota bacterium]MDA0972502.1 asparaginase [Bacteroidota bacterium]